MARIVLAVSLFCATAAFIGSAQAQDYSDSYAEPAHRIGVDIKGGGFFIPRGYFFGASAEFFAGHYGFEFGANTMGWHYEDDEYSEVGRANIFVLAGRLYWTSHNSDGFWTDFNFMFGPTHLEWEEVIAPGQVEDGVDNYGSIGVSGGFGYKVLAGPVSIDPQFRLGMLTVSDSTFFATVGVFIGYQFGSDF